MDSQHERVFLLCILQVVDCLAHKVRLNVHRLPDKVSVFHLLLSAPVLLHALRLYTLAVLDGGAVDGEGAAVRPLLKVLVELRPAAHLEDGNTILDKN